MPVLVCDRRTSYRRTGFRKNYRRGGGRSRHSADGRDGHDYFRPAPEQRGIQLLTNDRGRFSSATLPAGIYSVKVTLAGFLPAVEQDIQVRDEHTTLLEIVLGSVFTSLEKLRRQPDQQVAADDWSWVLRTSAATRPVLRWQDGDVVLGARANPFERPQDQTARARV